MLTSQSRTIALQMNFHQMPVYLKMVLVSFAWTQDQNLRPNSVNVLPRGCLIQPILKIENKTYARSLPLFLGDPVWHLTMNAVWTISLKQIPRNFLAIAIRQIVTDSRNKMIFKGNFPSITAFFWEMSFERDQWSTLRCPCAEIYKDSQFWKARKNYP